MKSKYMVPLITIFACIIMLVVDGLIQPAYWIKSAIKLVLFFVLPALTIYFNKEMSFEALLKPNKKGVIQGFIIGLSIFLVIMLGYFLASFGFDFSTTAEALMRSGAVNQDNFILIAIYITAINSFVEEFFFRGFTFLNLKKFSSRKFAYIFSAIAFAIYHVAMMWNWFAWWVFALIIFFLAVGGAIFNYLCEKHNTLYVSWIVHIFANLSINAIGLVLLGLV